MTNQISITRALAELKTLDDRITKATQGTYVMHSVGGKIQGSNLQEQEISEKVKGNFQSYKDLLDRRNKLKCAIVSSNAITKVMIGEVEMTVAEAIERKNSISFEEQMVASLINQYNKHVTYVEQLNVQANQRLNQLIETNLTKDRKVSEEEFEAISKPFMAKNEAKVFDPIGVAALVEQMQKSIEDFKLNVDFALSEINATTKIDV